MDPNLPKIKKIVLVMFENRSFDHLLGWLYDDNNKPQHFIPNEPGATFNGLKLNKYTLPYKDHPDFPIIKGTCGNGLSVPSKDPHEEYLHVNNQIYGTAEPWPEDKTPTDSDNADMKGFLQDYSKFTESWDQALHMTQTYTAELLPVISKLAHAFAVSDEWYSSVPTQTNPNRAFFHCGTSLGRESNQHWTAVETFETDTIWNLLPDHTTWKIYYHDKWPVHNPLAQKCYTQYTFPFIDKVAKTDSFQSIDKFWDDVEHNNLPDFTFLEPKWGFGLDNRVSRQGNDYHPPLNLKEGEEFLQKIYTTIRNSPCWEETLLIITFDEHGGTWDHVSPPWNAKPPDSHKGETGFLFDRFGVRVPTLLVSPWIEAGTVFRSESETGVPYDHTSIIATILTWAWQSDIWNKNKKTAKKSGLGKRVENAPLFDTVLTRSSARKDKVVVTPPSDIKGPPITIHNNTDTKLYCYLGYTVAGEYPVIPMPKEIGYLERGHSITYDTSTNLASWDYFVQASYWVGDGIQKPGEHIDHGYTGLSDQWRLFWQDWQRILHHQSTVFNAPAFKDKWTGDDKYGGDSMIRIRNESYTKLYYHLHYTSEHGLPGGQYKGELHRGEEFSYPSGKDKTAWRYTVDISHWVGDTVVKPGERVDSDWGVDKTWRFLWKSPKPIKHNQTVTIYHDGAQHPSATIEC